MAPAAFGGRRASRGCPRPRLAGILPAQGCARSRKPAVTSWVGQRRFRARRTGTEMVDHRWALLPVREPQARARGIRVASRRCRIGSPGVACSAPGILLQDALLADWASLVWRKDSRLLRVPPPAPHDQESLFGGFARPAGTCREQPRLAVTAKHFPHVASGRVISTGTTHSSYCSGVT